MNGRDPHSALKSGVVARAKREDVEAVLVRLQWGRHESGYSLHVNPTSFTTAGLQKPDFLAFLGFERSDNCPFTSHRRCYVKWVSEGFDPQGFLAAFERGFAHLLEAERGLNACGFLLPQPGGWSFFSGRPSSRSRHSHRRDAILSGDGHTAQQVNSMKRTEDDTFLFCFSFIKTEYEKGFVTHYRPKHSPLSSELRMVFSYLSLQEFHECPEFDFEPCFYRANRFQSSEVIFPDPNTQAAHRAFDAHASQFSAAIHELLSANKAIESCGLTFLPGIKPVERLSTDIEQKVMRPQKSVDEARVNSDLPSDFDVAISVAGPDRQHARELAEQIREAGFSVFYDEFYPEYLWGKDLTITFDEIFRKRSLFCVMFVSKHYRDRVWTTQELRSALARAVQEKGSEYILPIRIDHTELPGLLPTTGYLPIDMGVRKIGELLIRKLRP